jgi:hypothetical protein
LSARRRTDRQSWKDRPYRISSPAKRSVSLYLYRSPVSSVRNFIALPQERPTQFLD